MPSKGRKTENESVQIKKWCKLAKDLKAKRPQTNGRKTKLDSAEKGLRRIGQTRKEASATCTVYHKTTCEEDTHTHTHTHATNIL